MEKPHAPDNSRGIPLEEALQDTRWVPCIYYDDQYCQHFACQALEPAEEAAEEIDHDDDPLVEFILIEIRRHAND